jgi:4-hydroxybenzoate polyprenyltransferase
VVFVIAVMYHRAMSDASQSPQRVADASPDNWVDLFLPQPLRPYARLMRLDRPIGWWLLLLPCWWSLALAQSSLGGGPPDWRLGLYFFLGAVIMRGAGCTLNDIVDRDFDAQVARTRSRPIPSGQVSLGGALAFLCVQLIAGLLILIQFNWPTILIGAESLAIVAVYPFMKRVTYWPQVVLGLAFNWGALLGWTALHGRLALPPVLLYAGGLFWTLAYDTIYAHQDKEDDVLIGVKSTALKFGDKTLPWLILFFGLALLMIDASLWLAGAHLIAHIGVAAAALHAAWQVSRFKADDSALCLRIFKSNRGFGLLILAFLVIDSLVS